MPVYLVTVHAYRSWREDNPRGYVQRGQGLQPPDADRAKWRRDHASHPPRRFTRKQQELIHQTIAAHFEPLDVTLHALCTTATHVHLLISFRSPACTCGASKHCRKHCLGKAHVEELTRVLKRNVGGALTKLDKPRDPTPQRRKWFSRGWDLTPLRTRDHFDHHLTDYLPRHEQEGGLLRTYPT